jgi:phosphoglucosamine mutase
LGQLFGTDGVRGVAGRDLTPELALSLGRALGRRLADGRTGPPTSHPTVIVGRDSRLSGDLLQGAIMAGLMAAGCDVVDVGILPTPAVSWLTASGPAAAGCMISASHNPVPDNGIKVFGADGRKLSDADEEAIEAVVLGSVPAPAEWPTGEGVGRRVDEAQAAVSRYREHLAAAGPSDLTGWRLVVDAGHGAAAGILSGVLRDLGAEVVALSDVPDGRRINVECGATAPWLAAQAVAASGAHAGLTLDGDADRLIAVDERGTVVDGDGVLAVLAESLLAQGLLNGGRVVAPTKSNGGLARFLRVLGLELERTPVGDRYVAQAMAEGGYALGGEQSGHVLLPHLAPTGDGELTAMVLLKIVCERGQTLSALAGRVERLPQRLVNLPLDPAMRSAWQTPRVDEAMALARSLLGPDGRLVVRPSGTEPLLRVMAEGESTEAVETAIACIGEALVAAPA